MTDRHQNIELIGGDRRRSRRYPVSLELKYKVTRGRRLLDMGSGQTRNMSSGGIAFTTDQVLPMGMIAELWVEWPYQLNGYPMRLVVTGRVVRSTRTETAVRSMKHEFRLAGSGRLANLAREIFSGCEAPGT